jgi:hypothetical protein
MAWDRPVSMTFNYQYSPPVRLTALCADTHDGRECRPVRWEVVGDE